MYGRSPFPPNPYRSTPPFDTDTNFRSPRPRFHSSPRFHQQCMPNMSGPGGHQSPRMQSPRMQSPRMQSPNYNMHSSFEMTPGSVPRNGHPHSNRQDRSFRSGGRQMSSNSTPNRDCNPGGSEDISRYFHPSMLEDPWKNCAPVPVSNPGFTTT